MSGAVTQQLMGEIRLAWWRENLDSLFEHGPRRHPVLDALSGPVQVRRFAREALEAMVEARHAELDGEALASDAQRLAYIDATAGRVMAEAARWLDPASKPEMTVNAARAWGWASLSRAKRITPEAARPRIAEALKASRVELRDLPVAAFPAVAYAALSLRYLKERAPSELERRLRLVWATVRGRV